jgi:hypothetical protein
MRIVNAPEGCQAIAASTGVPARHQELARRLRAAEDRLFPLAMVDAQRYEWAVLLVARVAQDLRACCHGWDDVGAGVERARSGLPGYAREAGVPLAMLDADLVVDAAAAQRVRELLAEAERRRRRDTVEAARRAGLSWAVLEEPDPALLAYGSGQWVEVHVASGATLQRWVGTDPESGAPSYGVRLVSGSAVGVEEQFDDPVAWRDGVQSARASAGTPSPSAEPDPGPGPDAAAPAGEAASDS